MNMTNRLEDKVALTAKTKGKAEMIIGNTLIGIGFSIPVLGIVNWIYQFSQCKGGYDDRSLITTGVVGGVIAGAGVLTGIYGRIKQWYWNK